jgi:hypothetical protein
MDSLRRVLFYALFYLTTRFLSLPAYAKLLTKLIQRTAYTLLLQVQLLYRCLLTYTLNLRDPPYFLNRFEP